MALDFDAMTERQQAAMKYLNNRKNKYRARRTEYNGVMYDSKAEAEYAWELDQQKLTGDISFYLRQVKIPLGPDFSTRLDFVVFVASRLNPKSGWYSPRGDEIKGKETREFRKVRKLWSKYGPFPLNIIKGDDVEIIEGKQ